MKKVGLVTWYDRGPNYGTMLQAHALQKTIEKLGYECEIINYDKKSIRKKIKKLMVYIYLFILKNKTYCKNVKMLKWGKKNLKISPKIENYGELEKYAKHYDTCVCGSDQIWTTAEETISPFYYLQFVERKKRIAYAPSIGKDNIGCVVKDKFIEYVSQVEYLSVREQRAADVIKKETNCDAKVVLDPTLLLDKEYWENQLTTEPNKEEYIFVYFLSKNEVNYNEIKKIAKEKNLKIISTAELYGTDMNCQSLNPVEFLNCIKNAKYIATDSFHGTIFSIIFEKDFILYKRFKDDTKMSQNSRIYNLLEITGLNDRLVVEQNTIKSIMKKSINYKLVNERLNKERQSSIDFLKNALENSTK